jgi:mobilization protein NikA
MSRPPKETETKRRLQVIFRLTAAEHDRLSDQARQAGLSPNDLARHRALNGRLVIQTYRHCDPAFLKRLDRIGHNLNQLVKSAHIFGRISPLIEPLCRTIDRLIAEALEEHPDDS